MPLLAKNFHLFFAFSLGSILPWKNNRTRTQSTSFFYFARAEEILFDAELTLYRPLDVSWSANSPSPDPSARHPTDVQATEMNSQSRASGLLRSPSHCLGEYWGWQKRQLI